MKLGYSSPLGAEWHKWDLHVHTPCSLIQHYEATNTDDIWEAYIKDLESLPECVKVLGINDYQFLDGYKRVLKFKEEGRLKNIDLLLPVLEFRIKKFGGHKEFKRVNLHVIFSNELTPETIQDQFLNTLTAEYILSPESQISSEIRWSGVITRQSLEDLGRKIKASIPETESEKYGSDIAEGFNNLNIDDSIIIEKLRKSTYFEGKFLIAIGKTEWDAFSWSDNSIAEKKHVINSADFVFTASENPASYYRGKAKLSEQKVNDRLLDCSDSHYNSWSKNKDRIGNCFTWIKADRTFEGLRQTIKEPERIFIGDITPLQERVMQNPTKFIKTLSFKKEPSKLENEIWFGNLSIPLNPSLVAIIGNKGQGKSALADSIGLVGNSKSYPDFSFITSEKFKKKRPFNLSELFEATISWHSGGEVTRKLSDAYDPVVPESVKYIPQGFLEKLCNDDVGLFEEELKKVIYTHIPAEQRQGFRSLDEIIDSKSHLLKDEISIKAALIDGLNEQIVLLEARLAPGEKMRIQELIAKKEQELASHDIQQPPKVDPPDDPTIIENNRKISDSIYEKRAAVKALEAELVVAKGQEVEIQSKIASLTNLLGKLAALGNRVVEVERSIKSNLEAFGISWNDIVQFKLSLKVLEDKRAELSSTLEILMPKISETNPDSLVAKTSALGFEVSQLQLQLDTPTRDYQAYLGNLANWEKRRKEIEGDVSTSDTLLYYRNELIYLETKLRDDIEVQRLQREQTVRELFRLKLGIIDLYKSAFSPLTRFIEEYNDLLKSHAISLDVTFKIDSLLEKFFDHVNLGAKGSFSGSVSGPEKLKSLLENFDLNSEDGVVHFLTEVIENLFIDKRDGQNDEERFVQNQLKKGYSVYDLYNLLFNLEYLLPEYKLKLGGKNIVELSPGERGALLLIFYLTLDKDDIPLIIDQPEENLDNQSVFNILVQFILVAKKKRQIIIVTHNPNLAVVCDAEQIVHVKMNKSNGNEISVTSGAIENSLIRKFVVDILEGTYPAFDKRKWKYDAVDSTL